MTLKELIFSTDISEIPSKIGQIGASNTYLSKVLDEMKNTMVYEQDTRTEDTIGFIIDNNADILPENTWSGLINDLVENPHWNESIIDLLAYFKKIYIDRDWINLFSPWEYSDIEQADAGASFEQNGEYVIPWRNIDNKTYKEVRTASDVLIKGVIANPRHLQFTHEKGSKWIRLIMPTNPRRVEIEDLNRNFWVIGQATSIICEFLFGDNSPLKKLLNDILKELAEQWENMLYLWMDYAILTGRVGNKNLILDLPNNNLQPYRKFDNFSTVDITQQELTSRFSYLTKTYPTSKISLLVRLRGKNYYHNHYSCESYPYYGFYDGNTWTWYNITYNGNSFEIDISDLDDTGYKNKVYGFKLEDTKIYYGTYNSSHPAAALRVIPEIVQGGLNPIIKFTVNDAGGEMVNRVDKGTIIKSYRGDFSASAHSIVITKETDIETTIKTGSINRTNMANPFYGGEVITVGLKKVMK